MGEVASVVAAPRALAAGRHVVGADSGRGGPPNQDSAQVQGRGFGRRRFAHGREHLGSHFVAPSADRRPKVNRKVADPAPESLGHRGEPRLQHPGRRPAPARVEQRHGAAGRVGHEDGHAVGQGHRQQDARRAGRMSVALPGQHEPPGHDAVHAHALAVHLPASQHGAPAPPFVQSPHGMSGDVVASPVGGRNAGRSRPSGRARSQGDPRAQPWERDAPSGDGRDRVRDGRGGTGFDEHAKRLASLG